VRYAAIDIHKHVFQAAVLDPESGEVREERFSADRDSLCRWAQGWRGRVAAVAIEATTGWRWVTRDLGAQGFEVRLPEPVQARALLGRRRSTKTDRLDAHWLARLLAKETLPESWIPPAEIQQLRDRTRLRKALADDRRRWALRLHAFLAHEGWPCARSRLLSVEGLRWVRGLRLPEHARVQVDALSVISALEVQLDSVDSELRRFARGDERCRRCSRSMGSGRFSVVIYWPRSARCAASAAPARSRGWPGPTRSSTSRARPAAAAISRRPARRSLVGRLSRRRCTRTERPHPISSCTRRSGSAGTRQSPG
jgi:hypothetical protein